MSESIGRRDSLSSESTRIGGVLPTKSAVNQLQNYLLGKSHIKVFKLEDQEDEGEESVLLHSLLHSTSQCYCLSL
jgi:hypothetical protein